MFSLCKLRGFRSAALFRSCNVEEAGQRLPVHAGKPMYTYNAIIHPQYSHEIIDQFLSTCLSAESGKSRHILLGYSTFWRPARMPLSQSSLAACAPSQRFSSPNTSDPTFPSKSVGESLLFKNHGIAGKRLSVWMTPYEYPSPRIPDTFLTSLAGSGLTTQDS